MATVRNTGPSLVFSGVQINAIEIESCFFGGNGKLGFLYEPFEILAIEFKAMGHVSRFNRGKIIGSQRLQCKTRLAGNHVHLAVIAGARELKLCAIGQFTNNVVQNYSLQGCASRLSYHRGDMLHYLDIEIGGGERQFAALRFQKNI